MHTRPDLTLLLRRIELRRELSDHEKEVLAGSFDRVFVVPARTEIVRDGARPNHSTLLLSGFAARAKVTELGERQITALHVSGDFIDLQSFPLQVMDHSVVAMTDCEVATVPHEALYQIVATQPNLAVALWLLTLLDGAIHREWLVSMGATSGESHMAHLFCEMFMRLKSVGLTEGNTFALPMTQVDLGDTLGLTSVHVNRVLQQLRGKNLVEWDGRQAAILDWPELVRLAQFDPTHLHLPGDDVLERFGPEHK
jgi:CRP-like cAMP-binding protein